ncbi:MAG: thioredoxin family protein [Candidatus Hodarchaeales archaeon]|jgi:thiol-disulfide isomerase/thioredoxin
MKLIEQKEFFERLDQGLSFQEWLNGIGKNDLKEKIQIQYEHSAFLKDEIRKQLKSLTYKTYLLVILAEWCGDCHRNVPILVHIAEASPNVELKLYIKEQNMDLIKTTNGGEKIPYVIFYGQDGHHMDTWVERPTIAYEMLAQLYESIGFEKNNPKIGEGWRKIFSENQEKFYNAVAKEIMDKIIRANAIQGTSFRINS